MKTWNGKQFCCIPAFEESKTLLCGSATLVYCDADEPLFLSCDASQYGAGAVLSHMIEDGWPSVPNSLQDPRLYPYTERRVQSLRIAIMTSDH